jgi:hypothetical protein
MWDAVQGVAIATAWSEHAFMRLDRSVKIEITAAFARDGRNVSRQNSCSDLRIPKEAVSKARPSCLRHAPLSRVQLKIGMF